MRTILLALGWLVCCALSTHRNVFTVHIPASWPAILYDTSQNPLTEQKIYLGRVLFYDPLLSRNHQVSCASCHSPYSAFTHVDHALSHGVDDRIGTRNAPVLLNLAWQNKFMWDGAIHHLDVQALAPLTHHAEMDSHLDSLIFKLRHHPKYPSLFKTVYGSSEVTGERILKSLSAFMLTLISSDSKYDRMVRGEVNFSDLEINGYQKFKQQCASCHTEPLFTNHSFANNGLPPDAVLQDSGRYKITHQPADAFLFKVPTLRNVVWSYPYMHDGRFKRLKDVIKHYRQGIAHSATLDPILQTPPVLNDSDQVELIAFLHTLSDSNFIRNTQYHYPKDFFSN
jgi:cytochrome c peroxidase